MLVECLTVSIWSVCHAVKEQNGSTYLIVVSNSTVLLMSNEGRMCR